MEKAAANKKKSKRRIEDLDFDELISKFIAKDSQSHIGESSQSLMLSNVVES
jgi:antitoxin component of MazEF toxin-antitoxin module